MIEISLLSIQAVHKESYVSFRDEELKSLMEDFFANVTNYMSKGSDVKSIKLVDMEFKDRKRDKEFCRERNLNYAEDVTFKCEIESASGEKHPFSLDNVFVHGLPKITDNEFFIINGKDLYFILQLVQSPGMFSCLRENMLECSIIPQNGYRISFICSSSLNKDNKRSVDFRVRIQGRRRKNGRNQISLTLEEFLYAVGAVRGDMVYSDRLESILVPGSNKVFWFPEGVTEKAEDVLDFIANARIKFFDEAHFNLGKIGRLSINNKLFRYSSNPPPDMVLTKVDLIYIIQQLYAFVAENSFVESVTTLKFDIDSNKDKPGIFFTKDESESGVYTCLIRPYKGDVLSIKFSKEGDRKVFIGNRKNSIPLSFFLEMLGINEQELANYYDDPEFIKSIYGEGISLEELKVSFAEVFDQFQKIESNRLSRKQKAAINKVYKYLFNKEIEEASVENEVIQDAIIHIRKELIESSELGRLGRWQVNRRLERLDENKRPRNIPNLGYERDDYINKNVNTNLTLDDVIGTAQYFCALLDWVIPEIDDPMHIDNFMILRIGDYLESRFNDRLKRIENLLKDKRMSPEEMAKFFRERLRFDIVAEILNSKCCRYLHHTNALDDAVEKRRVTKISKKGIQKRSMRFFNPKERDIHWSYYGRLCPVDTPQNQSIGFVLSLTNHVYVDNLGRMLAPYKLLDNGMIVWDEPIYLTASEEEQCWIAYGDQLEEYGTKYRLKSGPILVRKGILELKSIYPDDKENKVKYIDYSPEQPLGLAACLIPFIRHDEPNRALMACGAMRQALPLKYREVPLIQTGWEEKAVLESHQSIYADASGTIVGHSSGSISVKYGGELRRYGLYNRGNMAKSVNEQIVIVRDGQEVNNETLLADCSTSKDGFLALGKNVLVAFMPWFGWNFEDAIVVSEKLKTELTSLHAYEYEYVITKAMFQADEERMRNVIKNRVMMSLADEYERRKNEKGVKDAQNWFNVTIHRECENRELGYELLFKEGDKIDVERPFIQAVYRIKKQSRRSERLGVPESIKIPKFDSKQPLGVYGKIFHRRVYDNREELSQGVYYIFRVTILYESLLEVGDKLAVRHGNKGVVSKIFTEEEMPFFYDEQGTHEPHGMIAERHTHIDVLLNPTGIPSRQNMGQLFETTLGWIAKRKGEERQVVTLSSELGTERLKQELKELKCHALDENGKAKIWYTDFKDGKQNQPLAIETPITVGYMYLMKLNHNAKDKINIRGQGGYAQVTDQPLKGRRLKGGQRLGEMEVWALLANNAQNIILEMLGCKSDEIVGRNELATKLLSRKYNQDIDLTKGYPPESLRILTFFLRSIGLSNQFKDKDDTDITMKVLSKEIDLTEVKGVSIEIASLEEIKKWANGASSIKTESQIDKEDYFKSGTGYHIGYIDLDQIPIINPIFKGVIEDIMHFLEKVDEQKLRSITPGYSKAQVEYFSSYEKQIKLLRAINLDSLIENLLSRPRKDQRLLRLIEKCSCLKQNYGSTEPLLMKALPVLPPKYRPRQKLENGKIAELHLSDFYKDILKLVRSDSSNKKGKKIGEAVERIFGTLFAFDGKGQKKKALYDFLQGKKGIPRRVLLGKRCDYSARTVITVNPNLNIDECILPYKILQQMYWNLLPFMDRVVEKNTLLDQQESARILFNLFPEGQVVLLNRNPTLHRMGIMAFRPLLNDDKNAENVIAINPLVTAPFGADFDGDQMAIFVPMLADSKQDAQSMFPSEQILSPASGDILANISQDIALGAYLLLSNRIRNGRKVLEELLGYDSLGNLDLLSKELKTKDGIQHLLSKKNRKEIIECIDELKVKCLNAATQYGCTYSLFDIPDEPGTWDEVLRSNKDVNPISWIYYSGARGSEKQMRNIMGVIENLESLTDTKKESLHSNLKNGLSVGEYYYFGYESRKTQVDKQLITPRAGWLTRKLVYATQHLRIITEDCSSHEYLFIPKEYLSGKVAFDLYGRWYRKKEEEKENELTDKSLQIILSDEQCEGIFIRSPLYCQADGGICQKCYGRDLSTQDWVNIGTPIGIIASQSIGERTTQLSLSAPHKTEKGSPVDDLINLLEKEKDLDTVVILTEFQELLLKVNVKHFEVVLRSISEKKDDKLKIVGLEKSIRNHGWLTRLSFDKPFFNLQEAALRKESDTLKDPLSDIMIGKYQVEIISKERDKSENGH